LLKKTQTKAHTTNTLLKITGTKTHTTSAYLVSRTTTAHTTNTLLKATQTKTHTTNVYLTEEAVEAPPPTGVGGYYRPPPKRKHIVLPVYILKRYHQKVLRVTILEAKTVTLPIEIITLNFEVTSHDTRKIKLVLEEDRNLVLDLDTSRFNFSEEKPLVFSTQKPLESKFKVIDRDEHD